MIRKQAEDMTRNTELFHMGEHAVEYSIVPGDPKIIKETPVLVMHGGHSSCKETFGYAELLDHGYTVITPSRAGYGRTSADLGVNLILHSQNDAVVPLDHQQLAHHHIRNAELLISDIWGHLLWLGQGSEEMSQRLIHFLNIHDAEGGSR